MPQIVPRRQREQLRYTLPDSLIAHAAFHTVLPKQHGSVMHRLYTGTLSQWRRPLTHAEHAWQCLNACKVLGCVTPHVAHLLGACFVAIICAGRVCVCVCVRVTIRGTSHLGRTMNDYIQRTRDHLIHGRRRDGQARPKHGSARLR
jgi:hypothetical protein